MRGAILDASAVLTAVQAARGAEVVRPMISTSAITGANWSEVLQQLLQAGVDADAMASYLQAYGLRVEPVTQLDAVVAARLWRQHPALSLGDRLCLALAQRLDQEAVTADKAWRGIPGVRLIR